MGKAYVALPCYEGYMFGFMLVGFSYDQPVTAQAITGKVGAYGWVYVRLIVRVRGQ